uniref:Leucine-rich repeat protein n=1 Tax=Paramoeba aestuarina TaxID=180227 RepID=A0A7S4KGK3_9EUKA|mmetsp:Transcript_18869/g.29594  ORF Transcript_18869/g.29594 Transcript_18869/m.29594 type:complete len:231 (+) Transcript_18869:18-710(+)
MFRIALTLDESLGRLDNSVLSEQSLMELLVQNMHEKNHFCDAGGDFHPIEQWNGVHFNVHGSVESIDWQNKFPRGGSMDFQWIPLNALTVNVSTNKLTGSVELSLLPEGIISFFAYNNSLSGSLDLTSLPKSLRDLHLDNNNLSGALDLTGLPPCFESLNLSNNRFHDEVDLRALPASMKAMYISSNRLSGTVRIDRIGDDINRIDLSGNAIQSLQSTDGRPFQHERISI